MVPTRGAGVTAAAGTSLTHHLFAKDFKLGKSLAKAKHLGFPYRTYVHCKGFAPAAPHGARAYISVPFSGLSLSRPLSIFGLVVLYTTNNLIDRQLILRLSISKKNLPVFFLYSVLASVSQGYPESKGRLLTCY